MEDSEPISRTKTAMSKYRRKYILQVVAVLCFKNYFVCMFYTIILLLCTYYYHYYVLGVAAGGETTAV